MNQTQVLRSQRQLSIVCCTPFFDDRWRWHSDKLKAHNVSWTFFQAKPKGILERSIRQPDLAMIRVCLEAIQYIKKHRVNLLITHDPRVSFWCAIFARLLRVKVEHYAYSFNFPELPKGLKFTLMKLAFANIDGFVVYSNAEKKLYSQYFGIPRERFKAILWSVEAPKVGLEGPLESGRYICAIGGNSRDYETLLTAMKQVPEIPLVIVVRPHNLAKLEIPQNVKPQVNIPFDAVVNILNYSQFMVLPLNGAEVPCGHVTLVAAMHLGKTFVITNSSGVQDYVQHNENAIVCKPFNPDALAAAIRFLWHNPSTCQRLGENARAFAQQNCSEAAYIKHLEAFLASKGA